MHGSYPKIYLYRRIVQSKLFIDKYYSGKIHLERIAGEAYFSKFHFIRLFKKIYGKTPHQYLSSVRMERSKELLREGTPVTETCFAVGFESVASFTTLFKRTVGQTPSTYQARQHQLDEEIHTKPLHHIPFCFAERYS
jgi:AraC-like DNA-binding protein